MPIRIPDSLPATSTLESENIFVMTEYRAFHQDIRPLELLILKNKKEKQQKRVKCKFIVFLVFTL